MKWSPSVASHKYWRYLWRSLWIFKKKIIIIHNNWTKLAIKHFNGAKVRRLINKKQINKQKISFFLRWGERRLRQGLCWCVVDVVYVIRFFVMHLVRVIYQTFEIDCCLIVPCYFSICLVVAVAGRSIQSTLAHFHWKFLLSNALNWLSELMGHRVWPILSCRLVPIRLASSPIHRLDLWSNLFLSFQNKKEKERKIERKKRNCFDVVLDSADCVNLFSGWWNLEM